MSFERSSFSICVILNALTFGVLAIINGSLSDPNEFPFMVSLRDLNNTHFCGGSIISRSHILTAAHCVEEMDVSEIVAFTGTNNLSYGGVSHNILKMTLHPNYCSTIVPFLANDIAILTLTRPLCLHDHSWSTIKLASKDYGPGFPATTIGFGVTSSEEDKLSEYLLKIETRLVNISVCHEYFSLQDGDNRLCTPLENGQAFCEADSGGPLIVNKEVVGVISYNTADCRSPSLYMKVFKYLDFINQE